MIVYISSVPERADTSVQASARRAEIVMEVYGALTGDANMTDLMCDLMTLRARQREGDEFDLPQVEEDDE